MVVEFIFFLNLRDVKILYSQEEYNDLEQFKDIVRVKIASQENYFKSYCKKRFKIVKILALFLPISFALTRDVVIDYVSTFPATLSLILMILCKLVCGTHLVLGSIAIGVILFNIGTNLLIKNGQLYFIKNYLNSLEA